MRSAKIAGVIAGIILAAVAGLAKTESEDGATVLPSLVINEIEINPPGRDADSEWVELLNVGNVPVDVAGWRITYSYRATGAFVLSETPRSIPPGGRMVFVYPGIRLRNGTANVVQLLDAEGVLIDQTPMLKDVANDARTWQRIPDGGNTEVPELWLLVEETRDRSNT